MGTLWEDEIIKVLKGNLVIGLTLCGSSVQFSHSVVSDFVTPWITARQAPLVHHQLLEFTHTHVHQVGDAIQPSHPRSSPSPPAPNPSQHQSLFQWVNSSHEVAKAIHPKGDQSWVFFGRTDAKTETPSYVNLRGKQNLGEISVNTAVGLNIFLF